MLAFLFLMAWAAALIAGGSTMIADTYETFRAKDLPGSDFRVFYAAAGLILSEERAQLYDGDTVPREVLAGGNSDRGAMDDESSAWFIYYNPPVFAVLMAPLTLLDIHAAYLASIAVNLVALAGLGFALGTILRWRQPALAFMGVALLGFLPTYSAIFHAQPTILIAVLLCAAFLAADKDRHLLSAVLLACTGLKPQWIGLPGLALAKQAPRVLPMLALVAGVIVFAPFAVLGTGAILDYINLLTGRGTVDAGNAEFGSELINWWGFFGALAGSPQPAAAMLASVLTIGVLVSVIARGDRCLAWSAAIFSTLIVLPHTHGQEWVMAIPAAALLLRRPMTPLLTRVSVGLLVVAFVAMAVQPLAQGAARDGERAVYLIVPAALLLTSWCAIVPMLERRSTQSQLAGVVAAFTG